MDSQTKEGQKYMKHAERAVEIFNSNALSSKFVPSDPTTPATLDGIIVTKGIVNGVVEIKAREETFNEMLDYDNPKGWLISANKIMAGKNAAEYFSCPFYGFLYCIPDDMLYIVRIFNSDGSRASHIDIRETTTQESCNGGLAKRSNAYIHLETHNVKAMKHILS